MAKDLAGRQGRKIAATGALGTTWHRNQARNQARGKHPISVDTGQWCSSASVGIVESFCDSLFYKSVWERMQGTCENWTRYKKVLSGLFDSAILISALMVGLAEGIGPNGCLLRP